jgi:molybdopterin converting factor small subunit
VRVLIPSPLLSYTDGRREVEAIGETLGAVLFDLDSHFPGIRVRVVDEQGEVRPHIRFWVSAKPAKTLAHPVRRDDEVMIVAALSGG